MCNAWNHSPGCNCGWGGVNYGTGGRNGWFYEEFSNSIAINSYKPSQSLEVNNAQTRLTKCWWCGEEVFYHTNGYGDSVLFDSLGYPWVIHSCWKDYCAAKREFGESEKESALRSFGKQAGIKIIKDYTSGSLRNTEPIIIKFSNEYERKRLIFTSIFLRIQNSGLKVTEKLMAQYMKISLYELHKSYGMLYELYMESKLIFVRLKKKL